MPALDSEREIDGEETLYIPINISPGSTSRHYQTAGITKRVPKKFTEKL
jgi:hypothetical protein